MSKVIQTSVKIGGTILALTLVFIILGLAIKSAGDSVQTDRDVSVKATIESAYVSDTPFGLPVTTGKRDQQMYYVMHIRRQAGQVCYVKTSWRWVLHFDDKQSVMWNTDDGTFFAGDRTEDLSQAFVVPKRLLPGHYTVSRLALFKCGDVDNYAKMVKTFDLHVE